MAVLNRSTPSSDQRFNPAFMRIYQEAVDRQTMALKKKKKSPQIGQRGGLESKIGEIENMDKVDTRSMLLDMALNSEKIAGRTDDGALMRIRSRGVGNWGMGKDF